MGHRICTSLQPGNRALQTVFHSSKEGWGVAFHLRSSSSGRLRHAAQVHSNVNFETNRATGQIRGLVCHDRFQGRILPHTYPSVSQEVPEVHFWGQSIPISGSSIRPSIITPHFHEISGGPDNSSSSGYSHNELHWRLGDSSTVASVGSSASRCRSCPHERVGVTANHQKECAFSTTEDHFSWRGMGLNVDAGAPVTGTYRVHPVICKKYKARPRLPEILYNSTNPTTNLKLLKCFQISVPYASHV